MHKIRSFLWLNGKVDEAARLYVSLFKNSRIIRRERPGGPFAAVTFRLNGQEFVAFDGGPEYKQSAAFSIAVEVESQAEVDRLWARLLKGGKAHRCGWVVDRFGVYWQIVPSILPKLLSDRDPKKAKRVMEAMFAMVKIDIRGLRAAHAGKAAR
jgi:predicted 3-demethylubiquinone-9 3-methyltransferase (glyoxalase superfamily)